MKSVSETELKILTVLWDAGPSPVRTIVEAVYSRHTQSLHTTVKSLLERLEAKGFVAADRLSSPHRFSPLVAREEFAGEQLQQIAESVFEGELAPVLRSLVDRVELTKTDRQSIERILKKLDQSSSS